VVIEVSDQVEVPRMHIPDALLSPVVAAATGVVGVAGLLGGLRAIERRLGERTTVLMGTMSAFIFAAQMVNFPLLALPVSGHLLGGVLAAVMLGPWAGAVVIASVLIVQCLLFADGGVTVLGANFVNMGLIGTVVGYAIYAPIRRAVGGRAGVLIGAMIAAWFSVLLASGAVAVELACSTGWDHFSRSLSWLTLVHAGIGLGEAVITGLVLRFILLTRPDLIEPLTPGEERGLRNWGQVLAGGLGIALAVGIFLAPFASQLPDGLEYAGTKLGLPVAGAPTVVAAPIPDYQFGLTGLDPRLATAGAGVVGTLVVFAIALTLARVFSRPSPERVAPDAA
jgi:cobalt/nickel transport system permease protein